MPLRESASGIFLHFVITNLRNIQQRLLESRGEEKYFQLYIIQVGTIVYYCHIGSNLYQFHDISCLLIDSFQLIQETRKEYQEQLHGFEFTGFAGRPKVLISKNTLRLYFSYSHIAKFLKVSKKSIQRRVNELHLARWKHSEISDGELQLLMTKIMYHVPNIGVR